MSAPWRIVCAHSCMLASGSYRTALDFYNLATKAKKNEPLAYAGRGDAEIITGDIHGAIADYSEAIRLNPLDSYAYDRRALAYKTSGDDKSRRARTWLNPNG